MPPVASRPADGTERYDNAGFCERAPSDRRQHQWDEILRTDEREDQEENREDRRRHPSRRWPATWRGRIGTCSWFDGAKPGKCEREHDHDERKNRKKCPAPTDRAGEQRPIRGPEQAGDDPRARQQRKDARSAGVVVAPGQRGERDGVGATGAEPLQDTRQHQRRHRRREAAEHRPGDEDGCERQERSSGPATIRTASADRRGDERGERKAGEDEPVVLQATEITTDGWHDGDDNERLDGHEELDEKDAGGELSAAALEELAPAQRLRHRCNADGRRLPMCGTMR